MSDPMEWTDLLDIHARALAQGDDAMRQQARSRAAARKDILALMDLAERVHAAYTAVRPHPAFRRQLREALLHSRGHRWVWRWWGRPVWRRYWVWGAVASVLSVAGGVGYFFFMRRSQAA